KERRNYLTPFRKDAWLRKVEAHRVRTRSVSDARENYKRMSERTSKLKRYL
ncbi:jg237, partial [Pararge aegeria aegeria]